MSLSTLSKTDKILITGASAGIGAVYADRFAKRGHDLILVARDVARLNALADRLRAETGVAVDVLPADLSKPADVSRIETRLRQDGSIGALVNNAGIGAFGTVVDGDIDQMEQVVQVNVVAATRLAAAAATAFSKRGHGALINLASVLALAPELTNPVYGGTKAFILNFSQALRKEVGANVQIQAVLPGATRTEIWARAGKDINAFDPGMVMDVGPMVDAALAGFDAGEEVTIPSLPDAADWQGFEAARQKLMPNLSRSRPADRYHVAS